MTRLAVATVALALLLTGAPRPATQPAPIVLVTTGIEQGATNPAAEPRTPAPEGAGVPRAPEPAAAAIAAPTAVRGVASWYPARGPVAAAGPALRNALGPRWRGRVVTVCASVCLPVRLSDWCQCHRGTDRERLIDLGLEAFALLERPSAGLVRVTILLGPPATDAP